MILRVVLCVGEQESGGGFGGIWWVAADLVILENGRQQRNDVHRNRVPLTNVNMYVGIHFGIYTLLLHIAVYAHVCIYLCTQCTCRYASICLSFSLSFSLSLLLSVCLSVCQTLLLFLCVCASNVIPCVKYFSSVHDPCVILESFSLRSCLSHTFRKCFL